MVVAFILMRHTNVSANLLSLGAIDFGIIVDGSIVMVEAILRRREASPDQPFSEADACDAARQVARPIFFATAVIITTYLPLFALQRIEAKLFYPLAYAVGYTQFGALVFALLVAPGLAYLAYRRPRRLFRQHGGAPDRAALPGHACKAHCLVRAIVYALSGAAAIAIGILGATVWREFLPELDEGALWLHAELPPGISLRKATDMVAGLRRVVNGFPEVSYVVSHTGRNDDGTDPWTPSHMEAAIGLHDYKAWPAGETKQELTRRIKARLDQEPGFEIAVSQPIIDSVLDKVFDPHSVPCGQGVRR